MDVLIGFLVIMVLVLFGSAVTLGILLLGAIIKPLSFIIVIGLFIVCLVGTIFSIIVSE